LNNTAARLGGDEFVVLLDGVQRPEDATYIAGRLLEALVQPFSVDDHELRPSASAGIAIGNRGCEEAGELLRHADLALYHAKRDGKNRFAVFDEDMRRRLQTQSRLESELRRAIDEGELRLQYQPIFDLATEDIRGFEALVRWDHAQHGRMWPSEFLPLAEEKGMMVELGNWVLREACRQTAYWRRCYPEYSSVTISVNLARQQLQSPNLIEQVESALEASGLEPAHLNIELTETLLLDSAPSTEILEEIRSKQINVHMDAFGDGVCSLSYLNRLPIRALKLDRSFVRGLGQEVSTIAAAHAVLTMTHARGLKVIASGIESPEELALLRSMGCDLGQGYLMSHPLDAEDVERLLSTDSIPLSA
jgi:EAL domain-containing protein (putative c-di-GMP-specific phosphodiesterase class I)